MPRRPVTSSPRCCPIRERVLGPEHPDTLATRGGLAYWTGAAGMPRRPVTSSPRWLPDLGAGPRPRASRHADRP